MTPKNDPTIQSAVENLEQFVPYEPNTLIVWGVVTGLLFLFAQSIIAGFGIVIGGLFLAVFITVGAYIIYHMTKKVNCSHGMQALAHKQKFMENVYLFNSIFAILMTAVLVKANAINLIYVVWIFSIGFASFTAGHILNQKSFTYHGMACAMVAFGLVYLIYFAPQGLTNLGLSYFFRALSVIMIGGGYVWLGFMMKKQLR